MIAGNIFKSLIRVASLTPKHKRCRHQICIIIALRENHRHDEQDESDSFVTLNPLAEIRVERLERNLIELRVVVQDEFVLLRCLDGDPVEP